MNELDSVNKMDSEDEEASERIRIIMEEIYKNQDKIKTEKDIEEMADRCTKMMTQMRSESNLKPKDKKPHRASGSGDKASPPQSRTSSVRDSKRDSTKPSSSTRLQAPSKSKELKKPQEMLKEKMEKMRVLSKMDMAKGDSAKQLKSKLGMGDIRRKNEKIQDISTESDSESSLSDESGSEGVSDDITKFLESNSMFNPMKDLPAREPLKSSKESEAHKKTMEWMSSTRSEQKKKIEGGEGEARNATYGSSCSSSSGMESEEEERLVEQLKAKLTMPSKKNVPDSKEALRKMTGTVAEKLTRPSPGKAAPVKKTTIPGGSKVASARPMPAGQVKPKKKI